MKHNLLVFILTLLVTLSVSCEENTGVVEFEVYEGGSSISRVDLKQEAAHQLSYQVNLTYPDKSVLNFYKTRLHPAGWRGCTPEGDWNIQLKKYDDTQIKGVRQLVNYFIHRQSNRLLMISIQYHSDSIAQPNDQLKWINDIQYITLVAYNVENLDKVMDALSLSCSTK